MMRIVCIPSQGYDDSYEDEYDESYETYEEDYSSQTKRWAFCSAKSWKKKNSF